MQTFLSLPHTLALPASFTPYPTAVSACFFLSLCLSSLLSAPSLFLLMFAFMRPSFFLSSSSSLVQVLYWSSVWPRGSVSYHPRHRPHHHSYGTGPGTRALAQHYYHRHPERSEGTFCTALNTETSWACLVWVILLELKIYKETSKVPPLTPAPTDEHESLRGLKECNPFIVRYRSTGSSVWCTSVSGLVLKSSGHEGNAVWRHK